MELRPYQERDLAKVREAMRQHRRVLLTAPCGSGKGTLCAYITHQLESKGLRTLFLVNRRILVNDMSARLTKLGVDHGVIMAGNPSKPWLKSHVASIDTLARRERKPEASLLIADECRFAVTDQWKKVFDAYPNAKVLGLDATPCRSDGRGLGEIFDYMVQGPTATELIELGHLVQCRLIPPANPAKIRGGKEFTSTELSAMTDKKKMVGDCVKQYKLHADGRKAVAFGVHQAHAQEIAEKFRCEGIEFAYMDCDTPDAERRRMENDLDHGNLRGISSVGTIGFGWDHPIVSCIVGARATNSIALWLQMIGRGSRPYPGKEDFVVLDHWDNGRRLDVLFEDEIEWSLDGPAIKKKEGEKAIPITRCIHCGGNFRSGPKVCPYCKRELPKNTPEIKAQQGDLAEFERERKAKRADYWRSLPVEQKRKQFEHFREIAAQRGYKKSWPYVRYKVIFAESVPREWTA